MRYRIPLLKDHHNHLSYYALLHDCVNLQEVELKTVALEMMQSLDRRHVSVVLGWNSSFYRFDRQELDSLPPVILVNVSLHSFIMSRAAEDLLRKEFPVIVENYDDAQWFEDHMPEMLTFVSSRIEPSIEKYGRFFDSQYKKGVYHVEEMCLPGDDVYSLLSSSPYAGRTSYWATADTFGKLGADTREGVKGIKLFTDGALGARTAALHVPYLDGKQGYLLYSDDALYTLMRDASVSGKSAAVHAIGDMASEQVIRVVRQLKAAGYRFPTVRMEHCQFIDEPTAIEAKKLGISLCMQPNFSSDSTVYADRISGKYLEANNPFRMLIDLAGFVPGEDLLLGSDGMPHGAEAALTYSLFPPFPQQRLTVEEFKAAYCMPDTKYGSIEFEVDEINCKLKIIN
jgi:predicted amidohydrolase YtcJ